VLLDGNRGVNGKKLNKYKEIEATDVQKYNRNNVKKI
jgi:hypothetical protein